MDELATPDPIVELAIGTLGLIVIIFLHGASMRLINGRFSRAWAGVGPHTPHWRVNGLLVVVIGALTLVHLAETLIWAAPIYWLGMIPNMRDSYFFVLESYTTLGAGPVELPDQWRLVGPIIAMSGLFTFGWTGSVLVSIMNEFGRLDRSRAARDEDSLRRDKGAEPGP